MAVDAVVIDRTPGDHDCPKCGGRGELYHGVHRNEWGVWDYTSAQPCHICGGIGALDADTAAEYRAYLQEQNDDY